MALLLALLLAALLSPSVSYAGPSVRYSERGGSLTPGPLDELGSGYRSVSLDDVTDATILRDVVDATVEGQRTSMATRRAVPLAGALALGARALGPLGAAATLYDLYTSLRCTPGASGLVCDDGVPVDPFGAGTGVYRLQPSWLNPPGAGGFPSPEAACRHGALAMGLVYGTFASGQCFQLASGSYIAFANVDTSGVPTNGACPVGPDGRCPGGALRQLTPEEAAARALPFADPALGPAAVRDALGQGISVAPYAMPLPATGPAALSGNPKVTTNALGQTVNQATTYNITYAGDSYVYNVTTVTTNTTTGETTTTSESPEPQCGLPGKPPCTVSIDETGTPAATPPDLSVFERLKAEDAQKVSEALSSVPEPSFGFIGAPPLVACRPYPLPNEMGEINACGVVDTVRELMGFLWALTAAWISIGWIREAVNGG